MYTIIHMIYVPVNNSFVVDNLGMLDDQIQEAVENDYEEPDNTSEGITPNIDKE